jgi:hypothetical protein
MKIPTEFLRELFLRITALHMDDGVDEETALALAAKETEHHARVIQDMERNIMHELGLTVH